MILIPEEVVTESWQSVAQLNPAQVKGGIRKFGQRQPALLAYALGTSKSLSPAAGELLVYMAFVVVNAVYLSGAKVRPVSPQAIDASEAALEQPLLNLLAAHDAFITRAASLLASHQPHLFRYLVETLQEAPYEPPDPVPLSPEEEGAIFLAIATVISALDQQGESSVPPAV